MSARRQWLPGVALLLVLALPGVRALLEASMWRHMMLQYPLLALTGALLAVGLPGRVRAGLQRWNAHGVNGLVWVAVVLAVLMVPRVLDLALRQSCIEAVKFAALVLAGSALRLSWRRAGAVLQFFFLGNVLPMMVVVGWLYLESPLRLCNAYLLDDQARLGRWLIGVAVAVALLWLGRMMWAMARREERLIAAGAAGRDA